MPLSRSQRFKLKTDILSAMERDEHRWDLTRKNVLLGEFKLENLAGNGFDEPGFDELIADLADADLVEMCAIVTGAEEDDLWGQDVPADTGDWRAGYVRMFISHSEQHRDFANEVADELALVGVHGFVAQQNIALSRPWRRQLEQALRSMQAFVALVHPPFNDSSWCQQEVGWALGRGVHAFAVRIGADPDGFLSDRQWPDAATQTSNQVASHITSWVSSKADLGETMVDGLFSALRDAGNYIDAGATAERVARLDDLTEEQWERLAATWWSNDQLYGGTLPSKALSPFYAQHGRPWPPPKPVPTPSAHDPWASSS